MPRPKPRAYPQPFGEVAFPKKASTLYSPFLIKAFSSKPSHVRAPLIFALRNVTNRKFTTKDPTVVRPKGTIYVY